jgi:cytochrome c-type biogenesis protein CcmE
MMPHEAPVESLPLSARLRFGIATCVVALAIVGLIGFSISGATAYYRTPAEMKAGSYRANQRIRVAGVVAKDTVVHDGAVTTFTIQDGKATLPITTAALLPDTFTAGVTVVAEGSMTGGGVFTATDVLAKCPSKFSAKVST